MKTTDISKSSFETRFKVLMQMGIRGIPRLDRRTGIRAMAQPYLVGLVENDMTKAREVVQSLVLRLYRNADPEVARTARKLRASDKVASFQQASRKVGMEHGKKIADGGQLTEEEILYWVTPSGKDVHADGKLAPNVFELCKHVDFVIDPATGEQVEVGEFMELAATLIALADADKYSPTLKVAIQAEMDAQKAAAEAVASPVTNLAPAVETTSEPPAEAAEQTDAAVEPTVEAVESAPTTAAEAPAVETTVQGTEQPETTPTTTDKSAEPKKGKRRTK